MTTIDPAHELRPGTGTCAACGLSLRTERGLVARCRPLHEKYRER